MSVCEFIVSCPFSANLLDIGFLNLSLVSSSVGPSDVELFDKEPLKDEELLGLWSWPDGNSKSVADESLFVESEASNSELLIQDETYPKFVIGSLEQLCTSQNK